MIIRGWILRHPGAIQRHFQLLPLGQDRWLEKGGYYIKMHCRRRVSEFDPRRGYMPKEKIGPERITVMRTSGPVFVLGGDYTVGSRSGLREVCGFHDLQEGAGGGVLSWRQ